MIDRRHNPNVAQPDGRRITDQEVITVDQMARSFGVNRKTVLKWIDAGTLRAFKLPGGDWRIDVVDALLFRDQVRFTPATV
jgi:excisionase family DNA binding protein